MALLPVADALAQILGDVKPVDSEMVPIADAAGRTLAAPLAATRTQPPFPASAMDGYAVRSADVATVPAQLRLIGMSAAGHGFSGTVGPGETVRIFTGAPVPAGADAIVIQEDVDADGERIVAKESSRSGRHIRRAGLDFETGQILLETGRRLDARAVGLAAAMGHATVSVRRKPRVAILATGDELVPPDVTPGPDQIVVSNTYAVATLVHAAGGEAIDLGVAADNFAALENAIHKAREAKVDILVTTGGASVGDHDLVQSALTKEGMALGFWQIAMRPGKPLMSGALGAMRILGLPGNPVSSYVCCLLFVTPLIRALQGDPRAGEDSSEAATLAADMPANDKRQEYARALLSRDALGRLIATPVNTQDSSITRLLSDAGALIIRAPFAPPAKSGDACRVIRLLD
ncbi:gephyrin-like molybdotransferase Glp [Terrarubrum flagellatum]|uniref:molybdopterin molybdotransferase MoeA n=1 Tax=Terrirubrum flagellatum TaxID=2895980 RepID=UPI003144E933